MRLILHMVVKNEADRYLDSVLTDILPRVDAAFVLDDQSTDDTQEILRSHEVETLVRPDFILSYEENPTILRYFAWIAMFDALAIENGDWILSLDADEFVVGDLRRALTILHAGGFKGADLPVRYLWGREVCRIDSGWNSRSSVRLVQATTGEQTFKPEARVPRYAAGSECHLGDIGLGVLNLSYADELDREIRMERHGAVDLVDPVEVVSVGPLPKIWIGIND